MSRSQPTAPRWAPRRPPSVAGAPQLDTGGGEVHDRKDEDSRAFGFESESAIVKRYFLYTGVARTVSRDFYHRHRFRAICRMTELRLRLQTLKLTPRRILIDRLLHDPDVLHAADAHAREYGMPVSGA